MCCYQVPGQTDLVLVHGSKDAADDRAVTESPETHVCVPCLVLVWVGLLTDCLGSHILLELSIRPFKISKGVDGLSPSSCLGHSTDLWTVLGDWSQV